ncbi:MAG: hypothetical protein AAFV95_16550 [Bacteroidota bacterium]
MKYFVVFCAFFLCHPLLTAQSVKILESRMLNMQGLEIKQNFATEEGVTLVFKKKATSRKPKEDVWIVKFFDVDLEEQWSLEVVLPLGKKRRYARQLSKVRNGILYMLLYHSNGAQGKWIEISLADHRKSERFVKLPNPDGIQDMILYEKGAYFVFKKRAMQPNSDLVFASEMPLINDDYARVIHWNYDDEAVKMVLLEQTSIRYRLRLVEDERSGTVYCLYVFFVDNQYSFVVKKLKGGEVVAEDRFDLEDSRFVNFDVLSTTDGRLLVCGTFDTKDAKASGLIKLPVGLFYAWVEQGTIGEVVFKKFHALENAADFYEDKVNVEQLQKTNASKRLSHLTSYGAPFSIDDAYFFPLDIGNRFLYTKQQRYIAEANLLTSISWENSYLIQIGSGEDAVRDIKTLSRDDLNKAKNVRFTNEMNVWAATCQQLVDNRLFVLSIIGEHLYVRRVWPEDGEARQTGSFFWPGEKNYTVSHPETLVFRPWLKKTFLFSALVKRGRGRTKGGLEYRMMKIGL